MKNNTIKPVFVRKISAMDTLLTIERGKTAYIPTSKIKTVTIRSAASRLKDRKVATFEVTEMGLVNETKVTRLS